MNLLKDCLGRIPWFPLIIGALALGAAPYPFGPEPHLIEKLRMLVQGHLSRPLDIFDLVLHGALPLLLAIKLGCAGLRAAHRR